MRGDVAKPEGLTVRVGFLGRAQQVLPPSAMGTVVNSSSMVRGGAPAGFLSSSCVFVNVDGIVGAPL